MDRVYSYDELFKKVQCLENELSMLRKKDQQTGVYNRSHFYEKAHEAFSRVARYKKDLSIVLFQIADMKEINSACGFDAGDYLLKTVARKMKSYIRITDVIGRISGDVFAILMEDTDNENAEKAGERIKCFINAFQIEYEEIIIDFMIKSGISSYTEGDNSIYELMRRADSELKEK